MVAGGAAVGTAVVMMQPTVGYVTAGQQAQGRYAPQQAQVQYVQAQPAQVIQLNHCVCLGLILGCPYSIHSILYMSICGS